MARTPRNSAQAADLAIARRAEKTIRSEAEKYLALLRLAETNLMAVGSEQAEATLRASRQWAAAWLALSQAMSTTARATPFADAGGAIEAKMALLRASVTKVLSRAEALGAGLRQH